MKPYEGLTDLGVKAVEEGIVNQILQGILNVSSSPQPISQTVRIQRLLSQKEIIRSKLKTIATEGDDLVLHSDRTLRIGQHSKRQKSVITKDEKLRLKRMLEEFEQKSLKHQIILREKLKTEAEEKASLLKQQHQAEIRLKMMKAQQIKSRLRDLSVSRLEREKKNMQANRALIRLKSCTPLHEKLTLDWRDREREANSGQKKQIRSKRLLQELKQHQRSYIHLKQSHVSLKSGEKQKIIHKPLEVKIPPSSYYEAFKHELQIARMKEIEQRQLVLGRVQLKQQYSQQIRNRNAETVPVKIKDGLELPEELPAKQLSPKEKKELGNFYMKEARAKADLKRSLKTQPTLPSQSFRPHSRFKDYLRAGSPGKSKIDEMQTQINRVKEIIDSNESYNEKLYQIRMLNRLIDEADDNSVDKIALKLSMLSTIVPKIR